MRKLRPLIFAFLLVPLFLVSFHVSGNPTDQIIVREIKFPVIENVSLFLDGSMNSILVNLTKPFDFVKRMVWNLIWTKSTIIFEDFGTLAGGLVNGTVFIYNGMNFGTIKMIRDFGTVSYDVRIDSDESGIKQNHLFSRLTFFKFVDDVTGLDVRTFPMQFRVQDDITAAADDWFVSVQGFRSIFEEVTIVGEDSFDFWTIVGEIGLWWTNQPWLLLMVAVVAIAIWKILIS